MHNDTNPTKLETNKVITSILACRTNILMHKTVLFHTTNDYRNGISSKIAPLPWV